MAGGVVLMPSVSRREQRYLYATKGSDWVHEHHFDVLDTSAKRPVKRKPKSSRRRRRR